VPIVIVTTNFKPDGTARQTWFRKFVDGPAVRAAAVGVAA
jgi:hypothetical protein